MHNRDNHGGGKMLENQRLRAFRVACGFLTISPLLACGSGDPGDEAPHSEVLAASASAVSKPSLSEWKRTATSSRPPKAGCFKKTYPSTAWAEFPCAKPARSGSSQAHAPHATTGTAHTNLSPAGAGNAGDGYDWFAHVAGSTVQIIDGSFSTNNIQWEQDPDYSNVPDSYCIQINSNLFYSPQCGSYSNCVGWQQYEYSSKYVNNGSGGLFMEYWLFNYPPAGSNNCPEGWAVWDSPTCHLVGDVATLPAIAAADLGSVEIRALANPPAFEETADWVELYDGTTQTWYGTGAEAQVLSLYQAWNQVEFNVVGDWNGTEAQFNTGASISVSGDITLATTPGGSWLSCDMNSNGGATAEYNNLNLSSTCPVTQGSSDGYFQFSESD